MHRKVINTLLILILSIITGCAEEKSQNSSTIIEEDNNTKYDFVYSEPVTVYSIAGTYDTGTANKGQIITNINITFNNMRNEEVYILIPESDENTANGVNFSLSNPETKCMPLDICSISFNMLVKEQSPLNDNYTVYMPVTLLNQSEMNTFIEINSQLPYKAHAMRYLTNRIYIKYIITGKI